MAVGLHGNLADFGIADVFQLIGQQRKTGVLELTNGTSRMQLVFDRGLVVSAQPAIERAGDPDPLADRLVRCGEMTRERVEAAVSGARAGAQPLDRMLVERGLLDAATVSQIRDLLTRDTIFDVLRWESGTFDFRSQPVSHDQDPSELLGAEQILMDGLRMVDEWQSFAGLVPSDQVVFVRADSFERFAERSPSRGPQELAQAERMFAMIDGRLTARRVIDLARLGSFDGTRCLAELVQGGAIRPQAGAGLKPLRGGTTSLARRGRQAIGRATAALVPLAALAGVVWWTTGSGAAVVSDPDRRIERSSLASLRSDYAMGAVRHALEAYRLDRGGWPERLEELESSGFLARGTLAALQGRPYYSLDREQGPILLAPER